MDTKTLKALQPFLYELATMDVNELSKMINSKETYRQNADLRRSLKMLESYRTEQVYMNTEVKVNDKTHVFHSMAGVIIGVFPKTDVKDYMEFKVKIGTKTVYLNESQLIF